MEAINTYDKELSCIVCPLGCSGKVSVNEGVVSAVHGFSCKRGEVYAREEVTNPRRMLTTTIRVKDGQLLLVPVVSSSPLPKASIMNCVRCLRDLSVSAPIKVGDIVMGNILGLGVDIVATRDIELQH